jgi:hypothetical protein
VLAPGRIWHKDRVAFALTATMKKIGVAIGLTLAFTASGQPEGTQVEYGPDDLATIVTTYKQDEARFSRDFAGKKFSGIMPFYSAQSSLVGGYYISLGSGIVLCEYVRSSDFNNANNWNRGDPIQVKGTIDDVTQGILTLKGCSFLKAVELK